MSNLEGTEFWGNLTLDDIIARNLIAFIQYGLLELGAYRNRPQGELARLEWPGSSQTIYKTAKHNIVWESGVSLKTSGTAAIVPTGIYVNGTGYVTGSILPNGSGYYIDFANGYVVFGSQLPTGTTVVLPHSLRLANVYPIDGYEFRSIIENAMSSSGNVNSDDITLKAYLPAIFVNVLGFNTIKGYELGSRGKVTKANIEFTIVAANPNQRNRLADICYMMESKSISLYDPNLAITPLNYRGELVNPTGTWPYLVNNYNIGIGRFAENARMVKNPDPILPISMSKVQISLIIDTFPN